MAQIVLLHLHPDFATELKEVLRRWNIAQKQIEFIAVRPRHTLDIQLLTPGSISNDEASNIGARIRTEAGYPPDNGIIVFTEKRLYDNEYDQLFVGGKESDEMPPCVGVLSLQYLRKLYSNGQSSTFMFKAIVSNIIFSLAVDSGLIDHRYETKGCIMDFCDTMDDIHVGLENGPRFCSSCIPTIQKKQKSFLLALVKTFCDLHNLELKDKRITEAILSRGKVDQSNQANFDYDIALSFAGEDRVYAEQLANELNQLNVKVFYDGFEQAKLWGVQLDIYLSNVYRLQARYCVVFISNNYKEKRWTNHELRAATTRAFEGNEDYILPIRLDDTEISGILPTKCFVNWHKDGLSNIVKLIVQKLELDASLN